MAVKIQSARIKYINKIIRNKDIKNLTGTCDYFNLYLKKDQKVVFMQKLYQTLTFTVQALTSIIFGEDINGTQYLEEIFRNQKSLLFETDSIQVIYNRYKACYFTNSSYETENDLSFVIYR